ncbi:MAG: ring-cleaving dioxygenase, partial [Sphingobacteriales bacterium]
VKHGDITERFGAKLLPFRDPDGLQLELLESAGEASLKPWETTEIKADAATRGFHSVTLTLNQVRPTATILTDIFGYKSGEQSGNRHRFTTDAIDHASVIDLLEEPTAGRGRGAAGTNHHIAFRVKNEEVLMAFREKIERKGLDITPKIDRDYFYSLYFREPGGVLFELATDNPGFTRDEPLATLGSALKLPARYENSRSQIEQVLPVIKDR